MTVAEEVVENLPKEAIPKERMPHVKQALEEVERIQKGFLPKKTGREFLKEICEEEE